MNKWSIILQDIIITFYFHKANVEIIVIISTQWIIKISCKFIWNCYFVKTVGIFNYNINSNEGHNGSTIEIDDYPLKQEKSNTVKLIFSKFYKFVLFYTILWKWQRYWVHLI